MIRILFVISSLDVGGAERSLLELVTRLPREKYEGVVCSLARGGSMKPSFLDRGIAVHELGVAPGLAELRGVALLPLLRRLRPDIVHARLLLANLWARVFGRLAGARVLCEERNLDNDRPTLASFLNRATSPLGHLEVANSAGVARRMRERDRVGDARLRVVPGAVDVLRFSPAPQGAPARWEVIAVNRLVSYKRSGDLLDAFARVRRRRPDATLALVGAGPERDRLLRQRSELGLDGAVELLGERADLPGLLRQARVFASASEDEGMPNAVLEAMSSGLPVVATRIAGSEELVLDGATGALVDVRSPASLAEALLRYLESPALAELHGAAGRERIVARFGVEAMVSAYERLYGELLGLEGSA
jgi:glycosyltransferase involved in cell wall biosynthesis